MGGRSTVLTAIDPRVKAAAPSVGGSGFLYQDMWGLPGSARRMKEEDGKVVVEGVVPGSAADQSGLLAGDIMVSMGGVVIADSFDLVYEVNQRVSGDQTALIVEREGEQIELDVTFIPLPKSDAHKP